MPMHLTAAPPGALTIKVLLLIACFTSHSRGMNLALNPARASRQSMDQTVT